MSNENQSPKQKRVKKIEPVQLEFQFEDPYEPQMTMEIEFEQQDDKTTPYREYSRLEARAQTAG